MTSERGKVLRERYRLQEPLGRGGMGSVWRADNLLLERAVALKELLDLDSSRLEERRTRAVREARALARVSHSAIVRIYDTFFVDDDPWIVMEYVDGQSLAEIIQKGQLSEPEIARIGLPVLRGLTAAHAKNVVHRDVKPANILVTGEKEVFLVDFGIAKISGDLSLTGHTRILGTPDYLAPEQILGHSVSAATDLWSLGVTFFHALEGYSPFKRGGDRPEAATMMAVLQSPLPRWTRPGELAAIVTRLLQREPERRADALELSGALQSIADVQGRRPPAAPPPVTDGWPTQPLRRPKPGQAQPPGPVSPGWHPPPGWRPPPDQPVPGNGYPSTQAIRNAAPETAAAMLLAMPQQRAAGILAELSSRRVGAAIGAMAAAAPEAAASILQMLPSERAGRAVDHLDVPVTIAVLTEMLLPEAARILCRAEVRTSAAVLMRLPTAAAAAFIRAMGDAAASTLEYVAPKIVADLLTSSGRLDSGLFARLNQPFQAQVMRYLPPSYRIAPVPD